MGARLLEPSQAEEAPLGSSTAGEGPAAGDAGVMCPALHFQVKGLEGCDRKLALTPTCQGGMERKERVRRSGQQGMREKE